MINPVQSYGPLTAHHTSGKDIVLNAPEYDLIILTATWESRGKEFVNKIKYASKSQTKILVLFFKSDDEVVVGSKEAFFSILKKKCKGMVTRVDLDYSTSIDLNFKKIKKTISEFRKTKGTALKILFDISCTPKSYTSFIFGLGFRGEFSTRLDVFYAEAAKYSLKDGVRFSAKHNLMTVGDWSIVQIPYFESVEFITSSHPTVISLGAEIKACIPLVERIEPKVLHVLHIENFAVRIPSKVAKREEPFLDMLSQNYGAQNKSFPLGDIHSIGNYVKNLAKDPIRCLLLGPKLHAIGILLAGVAEENIEINCRVPSSYSSADVSASGICHFIKIFDRFDPENY